MKEFKELDLNAGVRFIGEKIKIHKILDKKIIVHDYKVGPSKYKVGTQCLSLQIEISDEKRVVFTSASVLIELLEQTNRATDFPFKTTIVREVENGPFEFR